MSSQLPTSSISRPTLSSDLKTLLSLPASTLAALREPNSKLAVPSAQSALTTLDGYSPSTANPESSQRLIKAYINNMRGEVLQLGKSEEGAKLGGRIDHVRETGEGIKEALAEVKI